VVGERAFWLLSTHTAHRAQILTTVAKHEKALHAAKAPHPETGREVALPAALTAAASHLQTTRLNTPRLAPFSETSEISSGFEDEAWADLLEVLEITGEGASAPASARALLEAAVQHMRDHGIEVKSDNHRQALPLDRLQVLGRKRAALPMEKGMKGSRHRTSLTAASPTSLWTRATRPSLRWLI
jgi:hypothetical protein